MKQLQVAILAVAMLAACNSRREMMTSPSYGTEMLTGEVAVSGLPNASPAGVAVSVRGTGMRMILGESGEFVFAGVPEGAQLDFNRPADGIEASMKVDASAGFVAVELTKTTATASAKKSSRRRGVSPTRESVTEFEGVLRSASAESIVLFTSKKAEVTIALTAETIIRKGQTPVAAADLAADMRVHVKAKQEGELYTAVVVIVQNDGSDDGGEGEERPAARQHEGTVVRAGATELVVYTSHKVEVTFAITAGTVIRKGNTPVAAADLQAGWRVHVKATADNTATEVIVQSTKVK